MMSSINKTLTSLGDSLSGDHLSTDNSSKDKSSKDKSSVDKPSMIAEGVVRDYQLKKINDAKTDYARQLFIFGLLVFSATLFFANQLSQPEAKPVPIVREYVDLDAILMNKFVEKITLNSLADDKIPDDIIDLIGVGKNSGNEVHPKILLYEIIDIKANEEKIANLIRQADSLFKQDKLTSPVGNNALEKYEAVFLIDRYNAKAKAGIQRIVDRYVYFAESVIKKKQGYKVAGLIRSAYKAGYNSIDMTPVLEKYSRYLNDENVFLEPPKENVIDTSVAPVKTEVKESFSIVDVDVNTALVALRLVKSNDIDNAVLILEKFVSFSDFWGESYDALLNIYLDRGEYQKAEKLIYDNKRLNVFFMAEKVARIFDARNDFSGAIQLLSNHSPNIKQYPEYYSLQAALYYKVGEYQKAIDVYQKLLAYDYKNSRYWLGLAVALDMIDKHKAATAFQYAQEYAAGTDAAVSDYISYNNSSQLTSTSMP